MVCQLGDLVCDCSVIYFPDKRETVCVAAAASVMTSVAAVSVGGCAVRWPVHTPDVTLFFYLGGFVPFFFVVVKWRWDSQDAAQDDVFRAVLDVSSNS